MTRVFNVANLQQFTAVQLASDPGYDPVNRTIPQCMEVILNFSLPGGKVGHNVLHGSYAGSFTVTQALCNTIFTAFSSGTQWTNWALQLSTAVSFTGVSLRDLGTANAAMTNSSSAAVPGTDGAIAVPNEVALVATHRTARAGRAFRGRSYLMGMGIGAVVAGNVASGSVMTAANAWVGTWIGALSASALTLCVAQHARVAYVTDSGRPVPARTATTIPVTSIIVRDDHFDSQRRRGLK